MGKRTYKFNRNAMRPGYQLLVRSSTTYGRLIRMAIDSYYNHDAMVCEINAALSCHEDYGTPRLTIMIGDAQPPVAKLTTLEEYERGMNSGKYEIKVIRPAIWSQEYGEAASDEWILHVNNSPYDYWSIAKLLWRIITKNAKSFKSKDWTWYCTHGVQKSSMDAFKVVLKKFIDLWNNPMPTPRTTEKRLAEGVFVDITAECVVVTEG